MYVSLLASAMIPLILKKMLREMKIMSILLFIAIGTFLFLFFIQLCTMGTIENPDDSYG